MTLIDVIDEGKPFKHVGVYDGRWIDWSNRRYPILLSKDQIMSHLWEIEGGRKKVAKKKSKKKVKPLVDLNLTMTIED